jgi:hypothetical protein
MIRWPEYNQWGVGALKSWLLNGGLPGIFITLNAWLVTW